MRISPINFTTNSAGRANINKEFIPATVRHNSLSDMDFNIIADTIRCQNLKNQMNVRLLKIKHSLNNCLAQDIYQK